MSEDQDSAQNEDPTGRTLVYLVRHGLTEWNRERRFQGQMDVPLSAEGVEQAKRVADWLGAQQVKFAGLYSSDLLRARQTAEAIGERLGLEPVLSTALREIHVGEWQGLRYDEVDGLYPGQLEEWHRNIDTYTLPGGENITLVQERMAGFFEGLLATHRGKAFVVVSHGMALSALQAAIHDWDLVETYQTNRARLGNTGVTAVEIDTEMGSRRILFHNSSAHLENPTGMTNALDRIA